MSYGTLTHHRMSMSRPCWGIKAMPHVMIRVKRVLPRVEASASGTVYVVDTPDVARDIQWLCDRYPLEMNERTAEHLATQVGKWGDRQQAIDDILGGHPGSGLLGEPARQPRPYQEAAAHLLAATGRLLLADDVGLGKSLTSLLVLSAPDALPALVVTLTHLPDQWLEELALTWPGLRGHAVTTGTPYDLQAARGNHGRHPDVIVMNYAKLSGWADVLAGQVSTVIFDEVQELRRGRASFKGIAAAQVTDQATYAAGLSATPVFNYGGEIHNILSILSPDCLGSREEFLREWGASESNGKISVADPAALGTWLRDNGLMLRRTRRDVHREIPEPVRIRQTVDADPAAIDQLAGNALEMARMVLDTAARQQQRWTAAGDLDWRLRQATGVAKAPYVAEFVRLLLESEDKVVLFGWHRVVYRVWAQRLADYNPVLYTGSESPTQKQQSAQEFIHGDARVLMMSLRAGAGLDGLQQAASVAVFGELDWSPGVHDQCIGRLARDGQEAAVAAYFLVSDHGADPVMDEVLGLKRMQAEPLRDPTAPLLAPAASNADRVKLLAQAVIDRDQGRKTRAS